MHEITVSRSFSAEHAVVLCDETMEQPHRHDWKVEVTVGAEQLDPVGMVIDFHVLQGQVDELLGGIEGCLLNDIPPFAGEQGKSAINPSAEQIAAWLGDRIAEDLPPRVHLVSIAVEEAPGCIATYRP